MLQKLGDALRPSRTKSLAKAFWRLGWTGFFVQVALGSIPVLLAIYAFVFGRYASGTRSRLALLEYLTIANLLILVFTTLWFYWYTRLAKRIADPERRPPEYTVQRTAWTGVAASTLGIMFSMVMILVEVAHLLIHFLRAPQAGVPVIQTTGGAPASWVSAVDIMSLMVLNLTLFGEVVVLALSLWLLFRATIASAEYAHPAEVE
jgi:Protein of unknown function (DUF3611)